MKLLRLLMGGGELQIDESEDANCEIADSVERSCAANFRSRKHTNETSYKMFSILTLVTEG